MSKFIFILFLFFCTLHAFSQNTVSNSEVANTEFSNTTCLIEKQEIEPVTTVNITKEPLVILFDCNLCDVLAIKVSDLINESMLKKLLANV